MVRAFGRRVQGYPAGERRWQALVGIDIDQRAGTYPIVVELSGPSGTRRTTKPCQVWSKVFPTRTLRVDPDFVNPPAGVLARIQEEAALLRKVYEDTAASRLWRDPFVRPVEEPANSRFGSRSVYNGQRRSPHSGTDFLSGAGTPVRAPNAGHVVVARDLYFTGNTLVIDHGLGAVSLLAHLSRLDVHEGDQIRPGQIVGLVGATGRVTGPHLHWALRLAGARVDPLSALWVAGAVPSESAPLVTR
jgi:murein DD-endopeptidase MepM/ murein hydrolase activator NlpD